LLGGFSIIMALIIKCLKKESSNGLNMLLRPSKKLRREID